MSVCVVGSGLSGMAAAVRMKLADRSSTVVVISKRSGSNTRVAGQWYRSRAAGSGEPATSEVLGLLGSRNEGETTTGMRQFAHHAPREVHWWANFDPAAWGLNLPKLTSQDQSAWFGPQFGAADALGKPRGADVLRWFTSVAEELGIEIVRGDVVELYCTGGSVQGVLVEEPGGEEARRYVVRADAYVLAGGSPGGRMFLSTNARIDHSSQELAYRAGLKLTDASLFMFHILGNCADDGSPRTGCVETDLLAGGQVYLRDSVSGQYTIYDEHTTQLLAAHQAHYHFPEIARRFLSHGGVVTVVLPNGEQIWGRVSHHYSHLCVATTDGVAVPGVDNLFVVGDAAGTGTWSGHRIRFPGVALANCLLTAARVAQHVRHAKLGYGPVRWAPFNGRDGPARNDRRELRREENHLRQINTGALLAYQFGDDHSHAAEAWLDQLLQLDRPEGSADQNLFELSVLTAIACRQVSTNAAVEPILLGYEEVATALEHARF